MEADLISALRDELLKNADENTKISSQRFFKEEIRCYGVKTPIARKIAKKYFKEIKNKDKNEIFSLCEKLLESDFSEEAFIAFEWAYYLRKQYDPSDFDMFERWVRDYVNNWAKCDTLCNHAVGSFIEQFPEFIKNLKDWARSESRWLRRGSAVSLIIPARNGKFLEDVLEISDILLRDEDDLVQKGYGWMLKEASKRHRKEVHDHVMKNKRDMPRTALRYAIEKMPDDLRRKAMEK